VTRVSGARSRSRASVVAVVLAAAHVFSRLGWAALVASLVVTGAASADDDRPEIVHVAVSGRLVAGRAGAVRIVFRAPQGNVAAVIQALEDLDGVRRVTSEREFSVIAAAFGREDGELTVPLAFATPGRKRVTFTLLTDEREESEPKSIDVEVAP
jgi:hypothetical protein